MAWGQIDPEMLLWRTNTTENYVFSTHSYVKSRVKWPKGLGFPLLNTQMLDSPGPRAYVWEKWNQHYVLIMWVSGTSSFHTLSLLTYPRKEQGHKWHLSKWKSVSPYVGSHWEQNTGLNFWCNVTFWHCLTPSPEHLPVSRWNLLHFWKQVP